MFGADRGIIESGRDRMRELNLAFFIGEQKCFCSLQDAEPSALKARGVFAAANSFTARLNAYHPHSVVLQEGVKESKGIATTADASNEKIRKPLFPFQYLVASFNPNHTLK